MNNLLQERKFCRDYLNTIVEELNANERELLENTNDSQGNGGNYGNYNITVLQVALERQNYFVNEVTCNLQVLKNSKEKGMFLITQGEHHYAARRFVKNGPIIVFDSLRNMPYVDNLVWDNVERSIGDTNFVGTNIFEVTMFDEVELLTARLNSSLNESKFSYLSIIH